MSLFNNHKNIFNNSNNNIDELANTISKTYWDTYDMWTNKIPQLQKPMVSFILAGYRTNKEPTIYLFQSLQQFYPDFKVDQTVFEGYPGDAIYLCTKYYESSISTEKAKRLSAYLIAETASHNIYAGGMLNMIEINPSICRELNDDEIDKLVKSNSEYNIKIKQIYNNPKIS